MIFLHGGIVCPAEFAALLAAWPAAYAVWFWVKCRLSRKHTDHDHDHDRQ